ncbi:hypothetical protein BHE74_00005155 [Ensete ventricosum]|nr:hypothetical protein GW17_00049193 [Ensete ventricosum]RWW86089.1 hypothetical protein BHE74_00005155 [Ensete ventricosum]
MRVAPQSRVRHPMEAKQLVYVQSSREGIYSSANFRIDWLKWPPRVKKEFALYSACRWSWINTGSIRRDFNLDGVDIKAR